MKTKHILLISGLTIFAAGLARLFFSKKEKQIRNNHLVKRTGHKDEEARIRSVMHKSKFLHHNCDLDYKYV